MKEDLLRKQLEVFIKARKMCFSLSGENSPWPYVCNEDLVLRHGQIFQPAKSPPPVPPIPKACFYQCYRLAARARSRWIYCEGYAINAVLPFPTHHAWITPRSRPGEAFDLAWGYPAEDERIYMGICFKREFVIETHRTSKRLYWSVLDTWWNDYPLLTGQLQLEDVKWREE